MARGSRWADRLTLNKLALWTENSEHSKEERQELTMLWTTQEGPDTLFWAFGGRVKRFLTRALTCSSLHFGESLQQVYNAWLSEGNWPAEIGRVQVRGEGELALMWNGTEAGNTSKDWRHTTGWVKRISWWICLWWRKRHKIHKGMEKGKVTTPR